MTGILTKTGLILIKTGSWHQTAQWALSSPLLIQPICCSASLKWPPDRGVRGRVPRAFTSSTLEWWHIKDKFFEWIAQSAFPTSTCSCNNMFPGEVYWLCSVVEWIRIHSGPTPRGHSRMLSKDRSSACPRTPGYGTSSRVLSPNPLSSVRSRMLSKVRSSPRARSSVGSSPKAPSCTLSSRARSSRALPRAHPGL